MIHTGKSPEGSRWSHNLMKLVMEFVAVEQSTITDEHRVSYLISLVKEQRHRNIYVTEIRSLDSSYNADIAEPLEYFSLSPLLSEPGVDWMIDGNL